MNLEASLNSDSSVRMGQLLGRIVVVA